MRETFSSIKKPILLQEEIIVSGYGESGFGADLPDSGVIILLNQGKGSASFNGQTGSKRALLTSLSADDLPAGEYEVFLLFGDER